VIAQTIFERLGLGKNSSRIYNTLISSKEPLLISHISKTASIERPEVYRNIAPLLSKGFIEKIHTGRRTYYRAGSPRLIHEEFKKVTQDVEKFATSKAKKRDKELPEHILYFKGPSGIRAVFDDAVIRTPKGGTFYRYTSELDLEAVNRYLSPRYREVRDKKKLERLVISNPISGTKKRPRLERFIKFIPQDSFDQNIIQLVYADSIAFISLNKVEAFVIRDTNLARFQAAIFQLLYKKL
jgi:sugar-specific transcriptional regulator TrmB